MKRSFHPGNEWLYFRLYGGPETIEALLVEILPAFIQRLNEKSLIRKWFFIRYLDSDFHIRLRLQINPDETGAIILMLMEDVTYYIEEGLIWKTEIGTYEREIERYGDDWIETAENIFHLDSQFWLSVLPLIKYDEDAGNKRWQAALLSAHSLLESFDISLESRIELLEKIVGALSKEMGGGKKLRLQVDEKFRENRILLQGLMSDILTINLPGFDNALHARVVSIRNLLAGNQSILSWNSRLKYKRVSDLIHMSLNRGLRSKHRMHELVIYSFLRQLYVSRKAKEQ